MNRREAIIRKERREARVRRESEHTSTRRSEYERLKPAIREAHEMVTDERYPNFKKCLEDLLKLATDELIRCPNPHFAPKLAGKAEAYRAMLYSPENLIQSEIDMLDKQAEDEL